MFRTSARFVALTEGKVRLQKSDGTTVEVALDKLSIADRTYTKELIRVDPLATVMIGKVISVTDGDTITIVADDNQTYIFGLEGIDAPEIPQDFGVFAKESLSAKLLGKSPWVEWRGKYKSGRRLVQVYLDGRNINLQMVGEGCAWHYTKQTTDRRLANAEFVARRQKNGLWATGRPTSPWEFRKDPD
jgi:micrococcal nuclease